MAIQRHSVTKTPSGGTVNWNTDDMRGVMFMISIAPATSTTTYDFTLTDDESIIVYSKKGLKGTFNETTQLGLYGVYTAQISNVSVNEAFKVSIRYNELMR